MVANTSLLPLNLAVRLHTVGGAKDYILELHEAYF